MLQHFHDQLHATRPLRTFGSIVEANGNAVEADGLACGLGECCDIICSDGLRHPAEVIGFRGSRVLAMPLVTSAGIRFGDRLQRAGNSASMPVGNGMLGRVLNPAGKPLDGRSDIRLDARLPLDRTSPPPFARSIIRDPLSVGIRAIDTMLTVGRGQRIGIFGGSGVGKSTLIGMMTRNTTADVTVVGLVGERGREVREFLEDSLGEEGRRRSVVVVSTSDESPLMRMRAAMAATATAEFYASQGKHVLLVLDSLTRFAMAAREVGLAAGEPPATKGYPPSCFAKLARLLERAGNFHAGSITGFYTVLMEGDDEQDPVVDGARSILDGHIVLSRDLASEGVYPPIDVLRSLSRLMPAVTTPLHQQRARTVRRLLAAYARSEDLLRVGAYKAGSDLELDTAVQHRPRLRLFLQQSSSERFTAAESLEALAWLDPLT